MTRQVDPTLAVETFHDGTHRCRLCKCKLRKTNPEPYCSPCDQEYGPFPTVLSEQQAFARQAGRGSWGDAARKREERRANA